MTEQTNTEQENKCPKCNQGLHKTESIITFTKRLECVNCGYSKVIKKGKIKGNKNIEILRGLNNISKEVLKE